MTDFNLAAERRKQRRLEELGTQTPYCPACGEGDWRCFELHHIAGRAFDPLMVAICANCHRKLTDDQKDHPAKTPAADPELERIGRFLVGLADLFRLIVEKLALWGEALIRQGQSAAPTETVAS